MFLNEFGGTDNQITTIGLNGTSVWSGHPEDDVLRP